VYIASIFRSRLEHQTRLRTPGRASQTDVLALMAIPEGYTVLAVEGKCSESFAARVADWLKGKSKTSPPTELPPDANAAESRTRRQRLEELCAVLGLDSAVVGGLRYQLLHRTVAAVYEANCYRCHHAAVIVHSFTGDAYVGFEDFRAFGTAIGAPITKARPLSLARVLDGVAVTLGWVRDDPMTLGPIS
jgi:hypothetical protein